jgi:hypothetical protein
MKQSRFNEKQIIGIKKVDVTGSSAADLCRKDGQPSTPGGPATLRADKAAGWVVSDPVRAARQSQC